MKKSISVFLATVLLLCIFSANILSVSAKEDVSKYYEYSVTNGEACIYQIHLTGEVKIPKKIDGYPVTAIDAEPDINRGITSIVIPEGVKRIALCSFENCDELTDITLPDSLESIGTDAFKGTGYYNDKSNWKKGVLYIGNHLLATKNSLSGEYKIKEGTLTIADKAFYSCTDLTDLTIPKSVKNVGKLLFTNCAQLENISVSKDNKYFSAKDAILYNKNKTEVLTASGGISGNITLPKTVKSIRNSAFQQCSCFTGIKLPEGLEKIGDEAFYACTSLKKINIPDSVKEVGNSILHATEYYDTQSNWDNYVLYVDKHLVDSDDMNQLNGEYTVKDGTLTIANGSFCYSQKLKKLNMPDSVIYLGAEAFWECTKLKSIKLSKNLTKLNDATFWNCVSLEKVKLYNGITEIGASAFRDCIELKETNIPKSVKKIGNGAYANCRLISEITIPEGVKTIEGGVFSGCRAIKEIALPKTVTEIGNGAFRSCVSLAKLTLPKSLKKIGKSAFQDCGKIVKVIYKGTKKDHKKIDIGKDNYGLTTVPWTYKPEKTTTSKKETTSKKPVTQASSSSPVSSKETTTSKEIVSNEDVTSSKITSTPSQSENSSQADTKPENKQKNIFLIWIFVAAIILGAVGGFTAFSLTNKKKN